ncbi:MAG: hypothetical protein HQL94_09400 [Magnetococcales bacterium]|nr:hypothetical protein [Magnetococcales bacterium]
MNFFLDSEKQLDETDGHAPFTSLPGRTVEPENASHPNSDSTLPLVARGSNHASHVHCGTPPGCQLLLRLSVVGAV